MREGRGFLVSITMTELLILLFFLLLLLATSLILDLTRKKEFAEARAAEATSELIELRQVRDLVESRPDLDFTELIRSAENVQSLEQQLDRLREREEEIAAASRMEPEDIRELAEQMEALEQQMEELSQREAALAAAQDMSPEDLREAAEAALDREKLEELESMQEQLAELADMSPKDLADLAEGMAAEEKLQELEKERSLLKGQIANLRRRCGSDYPPCWVEDEVTGRPEYIYDVTIFDDHFIIEPIWPASRQTEMEAIPGARELPGTYWSLAHFRKMARPVLVWSDAQECRHFVKIRDAASSKEPFLDRMTTIEEFFYKLLIRKAG